MEIVIYAHDFHLAIGHSNAMIELLRHVNLHKITSIEILSYTCSQTKELFPGHGHKVVHIKVPFKKIPSALFKNFFYHLWSYIYHYRKKITHPKSIHISIGAASLVSDIVNIQFVHAQWNPLFFKKMKISFFRKIYKIISYHYFAWSEKVYFQNPQAHFLAVSDLAKNFCVRQFNIPQKNINTVYSGVNLKRFCPVYKERNILFNRLSKDYPQLKHLDLQKPILLFIGSFERKGLPLILKWLKKIPQTQLLIIGSAENKKNFDFSGSPTICHINFSNNISAFYDLADTFVFPSLYDPFALVILEAFAKGIPIVTYKFGIGASELITGEKEVYFLENIDIYRYINSLKILTSSQRNDIQKSRAPLLSKINWQSSGKIFQEVLEYFQS